MTNEQTCACGNCDWSGPISAAKEPRDLWARVDAGCEVPAGECPQCGALAYLPETILERAITFVNTIARMQTGTDIVDGKTKEIDPEDSAYTLNRLITEAREISVVRPDGLTVEERAAP